jgi:hypothetical protein
MDLLLLPFLMLRDPEGTLPLWWLAAAAVLIYA